MKLETDYQKLRLTKVHSSTTSSRFFANYFYIFHKIEVQMVILRCWTGLNLNGTKRKYYHFSIPFLRFLRFWLNLNPTVVKPLMKSTIQRHIFLLFRYLVPLQTQNLHNFDREKINFPNDTMWPKIFKNASHTCIKKVFIYLHTFNAQKWTL